MLSVLFSSALGFGSSFLPSLLKFAENRQKAKLEIQMMETKAKFAKELSSLKLKIVVVPSISNIFSFFTTQFVSNVTLPLTNNEPVISCLSSIVSPNFVEPLSNITDDETTSV